MKKLMLLSFIMLFLVGTVQALEYTQTGKTINITFECVNYNTGNACNSSASCNMTVRDPNGSISSSGSGIYSDGFFDYEINGTNLTQNGIYKVTALCDDGINTASSFKDLEVNSMGREVTTSQSIFYGIILALMSGFTLLTFYGSLVLPWRNKRDEEENIVGLNDLKYLKLTCIVLTYLFLMWTAGIMFSLSSNFAFLEGTANFFNFIFQVMLRMIYPAMIIAFVFIIIFLIQDKKIKKTLSRIGSFKPR